MRPVRITIEGLRSFRAEVGIDFGDRTQIAVIGDTGAGKSSILEAMTYALYGQTSLGSRSKQELMNDTSDMMRVVFRFRVGGEEWEVTRVDRRTGAGGLRPARAQLVRYGPGGETMEKVEQVRPVNDRIQALIGLESDAFLRTVILPQGRFARLLVEDAPSARTEILRQVWRTNDLEAAGEVVGRRLQEIRTLHARLADAVERYPEDPEEHLAELASRAASAARDAETLTGLRDQAKRARKALCESEAAIAAATRVDKSLTPATIDELAVRLAPVDSAWRRIDAERAELESREASLKRDLNSIPTDDGPDQRAVASTLAVLDALPEQAETAVQGAEALRGAIAGEAEARTHLDNSRRALEAAKDRLTRHEAREPLLGEGATVARNSLTNADRLYEKCAGIQDRLLSTRGELVKRREEVANTAARLVTARDDETRANREAERAEAAMAAAQRKNAAATAAHGLHTGDECPICRRDLPEDWAPPPDQGLDAARATLEATQSRTGDVSKVTAGLEAQEETGRQRIVAIEKELDERGSEMAEALDRLRSAAGLDEAFPPAEDGPFPDREQVLASVQHRLREAEAKLSKHRLEAESLTDARTRALVDRNSAGQTLKHVSDAIGRTRDAVDSALDGLNRNIQSIPTPFRPRLVLPTDPLELETVDITPVDRASYAAREREEILQMRDRKRQGLHAGIEETRTKLRRLGETRKAQVEEPVQAIVRELADHRSTLADVVRPLDADITLPVALYYPIDTDKLAEGIGRLREASVEALKLARDLRRRALEAAGEARTEARRIAERLDRPADATDLDALVQAAEAVAGEARYAALDTKRIRDAFAAILNDVVELRKTADEVRALELALGDLDATFKPGAFLKWLTLRRSRDLLLYASRMLEEMTGGRYAFADPGALEDQQWLVVDNDSGQARSPASLSGGEQFIGSLALALGMVEMMARSGGRLESLFLDEGFGSLDRGNLDSAIEALSTVARKGRMVGVISHISAVAEQIDDVLAVTRSASGSQVAWLSRDQRQELVLADTGMEGTSAVAGLLD